MAITTQAITPSELLCRVYEETQCLMDMRRESQEIGDLPDIPEEQDASILRYQNGLLLIGKAWDIQDEAKEAMEHLRNTAPEESKADGCPLAEGQLLSILWGLFDTAVQLNDLEERKTIYELTQDMMDFHDLDLRTEPN